MRDIYVEARSAALPLADAYGICDHRHAKEERENPLLLELLSPIAFFQRNMRQHTTLSSAFEESQKRVVVRTWQMPSKRTTAFALNAIIDDALPRGRTELLLGVNLVQICTYDFRSETRGFRFCRRQNCVLLHTKEILDANGGGIFDAIRKYAVIKFGTEKRSAILQTYRQR